MFSTPRSRSVSPAGAATENGTSKMACSRLVAVTLTSSVSSVWRRKSSGFSAPAETSTSCTTRRNPSTAALTEYMPGNTEIE